MRVLGELNYESLSVQPTPYRVGVRKWEYDFDVEIEVGSPLLREYVMFVSAVESSVSTLDSSKKFCEVFTDLLIESGVPYAFEHSSVTHSVQVPHSLLKDMLNEFNAESEGALDLTLGTVLTERLERIYQKEVGFSPDEDIPGPAVPPISHALCPQCESPLNVMIYDDQQNHMHCGSCAEIRPNPAEWKWLSIDTCSEYSGEKAENQDPSRAGCPNCGSWLNVHDSGTIGSCLNCAGLWPKGTCHHFEPVLAENAACPECGSKFDEINGGVGICRSCIDSPTIVDRKDWVEYDPVTDQTTIPYEVEPGVQRVGKRRYRVEQTGHIVDSLWEADIDKRLSKQVQGHQREPKQFKIDDGHYWPDFRVGDIIIEVKGIQRSEMLESAINKATSFRERYPNLTYVVIGDEKSKEIPCDKWFEYPSEQSDAISWISRQASRE